MISVSKKDKTKEDKPADEEKAKDLNSAEEHHEHVCNHPQVIEVRPKELECDVVRFQNNKEKWGGFRWFVRGLSLRDLHGLAR